MASHGSSQYLRSVLLGLLFCCVEMAQAGAIWEERTSAEKKPLSDWSVCESVEEFLDWQLIEGGPAHRE